MYQKRYNELNWFKDKRIDYSTLYEGETIFRQRMVGYRVFDANGKLLGLLSKEKDSFSWVCKERQFLLLDEPVSLSFAHGNGTTA